MTQSVETPQAWTIVIRPARRWFDLRLRELWQYRELVLLLVRRDFVATYKQTILGPLWYLIQPLVTTGIFLVFGRMAGLSTDGAPPVLFYMLGTVVWAYFSVCLVQTSGTFVLHASLFGKVYFPRLVVPVATVLSNLMMFALQLLQFVVIAVWIGWSGPGLRPTMWLFATPLLLAMMAALGLGLGMAISSLTTRYRDLQYLVAFGTPLLLYTAPVIYPLSSVPERYTRFVSANPMTPIIEAFRAAFLGVGTVSAVHLLYSGAVAAAVLFGGVVLFNRVERTFMDTV